MHQSGECAVPSDFGVEQVFAGSSSYSSHMSRLAASASLLISVRDRSGLSLARICRTGAYW